MGRARLLDVLIINLIDVDPLVYLYTISKFDSLISAG